MIVARTQNIDNRISQKRAKRYVFYPLSNLSLHDSQALSPVWQPVIKRGEITLFETLEYRTQVENQVDLFGGGGGVQLGWAEMGTDSQVNFVMGMYEARGMTSLTSLLDIDPEIAQQVQDFLFPKVPENLTAMGKRLAEIKFKEDDQFQQLAKEVAKEMMDGINRAILFCNKYCNEIEKELQDFRSGKLAFKGTIDGIDSYYYNQIQRPTPRDKDLVFQAPTPVYQDTGLELKQTQAMLEAQGALIMEMQKKLEEKEVKGGKSKQS